MPSRLPVSLLPPRTPAAHALRSLRPPRMSFTTLLDPPAADLARLTLAAPAVGEGPRLRLLALEATRRADGAMQVTVRLERVDGFRVIGTAEAPAGLVCGTRAAAEATLQALAAATSTGHRFELLGVKSVRAFDESIVLVQVRVLAGRGPARLVGCAMDEGDALRATVLAVLHATNRVLGLRDGEG